MSHHCASQINDGNTRDIACPEVRCPHKVSYQEVKHLVDKATMAKFEKFLLKQTLDADQSVVWCPRPGCGMAMYGEGGLMVVCPSEKCRFTFCRKCKVEWHADATCAQYKQWKIDNDTGDQKFERWAQNNTKVCFNLKCRAPIEKNGG